VSERLSMLTFGLAAVLTFGACVSDPPAPTRTPTPSEPATAKAIEEHLDAVGPDWWTEPAIPGAPSKYAIAIHFVAVNEGRLTIGLAVPGLDLTQQASICAAVVKDLANLRAKGPPDVTITDVWIIKVSGGAAHCTTGA
jgi:hypothetical protein